MASFNKTYPVVCLKDRDCNPYISNRLCYHGASWLGDNDSECQCNIFYGWQGADCTQYGLSTILSVVLYASVALVSLLFFVKGLLRLHQRSCDSPGMRFFPLTAANTTMSFVVLGWAGSAIVALFTILNFVVVRDTPALEFVTYTDGFGRFEYFTRNLAQPLLGLACSFSQLNVCLMWIDLAAASKKLRVSTRTNLEKSRRIVVVFEVLLMTSVVVALVLQGFSGFPVMSALSVPFTLAVIVLYVLGDRQMVELMSTMVRSSDAKYKNLQRAIRKTTIAVIGTDVIFIIAQMCYAVVGFNNALRKDLASPGDVITLEKVSHHLIFTGMSLSNFILWRYLTHAENANAANDSECDVTDTLEKQSTQQDIQLA
jgi:hypothetical protein